MSKKKTKKRRATRSVASVSLREPHQTLTQRDPTTKCCRYLDHVENNSTTEASSGAADQQRRTSGVRGRVCGVRMCVGQSKEQWSERVYPNL